VISNIIPDWKETWTIAEAEAELSGFVFRGPGWYKSAARKAGLNIDYLLVTTANATARANQTLYRFYVYNGRNPIPTFKWVGTAPVFE